MDSIVHRGASVVLSSFLWVGLASADGAEEDWWWDEPPQAVAMQDPDPQPPLAMSPVDDEAGYRIGVRDLLEIDVFRVPELTRKVRVDANGRIALPLVGSLTAAGKTPEALAQEIARRLAHTYVNDPFVTVFVAEYESQRVTVEGAVNRPGIFPLKGRTTLLQVVAQAEGLTDLADARDVQLFRTFPDGRKAVFTFDVDAIRRGAAPDPVVQADDVVVVRRSGPKSFVRSVSDTLRGFITFGNVRR